MFNAIKQILLRNNSKSKIDLNNSQLHIYEIKKDGNCLFRCISLYLYNTQKFHNIIREHMINYMILNKKKFKNSIYLENMTIDSWIWYMKQNGIYGDALALEALSYMLECKIIINIVSTNKVAHEYMGIWFKNTIKLILCNKHYTLLK